MPTGRQASSIACPGCGTTMRALLMEQRPHGESTVDLCDGCHALWLDAYESVRLTPGATIALFREVVAASAAARRALPVTMPCPRCRRSLLETQDLRHATRFSYWRCAQGHGRFTPFVQFLREKDFIRPLEPAELARLRAHVRTIRCGGCGAAVDLARDMVCSFCRAPVEAVDPDAVAKALQSLGRAATRRASVDVDALADAILAPHRNPAGRWTASAEAGRGPDAGDLIGAGLALVLAAFAD